MAKPAHPGLLVPVVLLASAASAQTSDTAHADRARQVRIQAADFQRSQPLPAHVNNGDEARYPSRFASYSKGLPHDAFGEPDPVQYDRLLQAVLTGNPADFEAIVLGGTRKLVNPLAGYALTLEGADPRALTMAPAPAFEGAEAAGEMEELYWMSLVRDVPFNTYGGDATVAAAIARLNALPQYRGMGAGGTVNADKVFRADVNGAQQGCFVSQFLLKPIPYSSGPLAITSDTNPAPGVEPTGGQLLEQRNLTRFAGDDRVTAYNEWLDIQNGRPPADPTDTLEDYDPVRRYIRNGRDLAEYVHLDYPFQSSLSAALLMARQGDFLPDGTYDPDPKSSPRAFNQGNPYLNYRNQDAFITFGNSDAQSLTTLVTNTALRSQWFQKWAVHRRLRPEEYGGRVHNTKTGVRTYPVPAMLLNSPVLTRVRDNNLAINTRRGLSTADSYLLAQAFPEGSPIHPAYASGHSTYIGAGVTILKAFYRDFEVTNPVTSNTDGTALVPCNAPVTFYGELHKLTSNIGVGRLFGGVHYRSDHDQASRLGELYALRALQDWARLYREDTFPGFKVDTFQGSVTVTATQPQLPNHVATLASFTLMDAQRDVPVPGFNPLFHGAVIDLSNLAAQGITQLNVRMNTWPESVGSVRIDRTGVNQAVDSTPPYSLEADADGDYAPISLPVGTHRISAVPFSEGGSLGVGGVPLTISITVQQ
ncbi:phosphoesterase [Pyxidicoccus fallax]|uniref:Phosphoesterase n=1 Tax=Pyxidicoccus fallax TaxID=394095 RepID=A0A848LVY4_9BACT|nr:phosphoesterase [Pyxidicoccus fallax]NMO22248.1 phosphoesterase [Pyxidicoccus fallax]NPC83962.1 phosphoesterase [Pyxidicoccus fallax]